MFFDRMMDVEDVEIRAALASLGFGNWESNIESRLSDFALYYGEKSSRTVRRWAEQGFRKIADLVIEWSIEEAHDNPLIEVVLRPLGATMIVLT